LAAWSSAFARARLGDARFSEVSGQGDRQRAWDLYRADECLARVLVCPNELAVFMRLGEKSKLLWRVETSHASLMHSIERAGSVEQWFATVRQLRPRYEMEFLRDWTGKPCYCYRIDGMWIGHPRLSECGRFAVDPLDYYGLTPEELAALDAANGSLTKSEGG
jgi:hypothetical protein